MIFCYIKPNKLIEFSLLNGKIKNWLWNATPIIFDGINYTMIMRFSNLKEEREEKLSWTYRPNSSPYDLIKVYAEHFLN